jgi:hypothetical protein
MERGGIQPHHTGEQVREESLSVAQEGALALDATELLEERERDDLRVREPLERLVASSVWVEQRVGVSSMRQKRTVRASSARASRGVRLARAIFCSLARGDYDVV